MTNSPQHDGGGDGGGGGGKRPVDVDGGGGGEGEAKRRKGEEGVGEEEMKRVAELVLVLSAMGRMRGGRDPTVAETEMMAEARRKVVAMCEEFSPKDILPKEACDGVMDDLGFTQRLGFRHNKMSISDTIAHTQRRMEEAKAFAAQPASCQSQRLQSGNGAAGEIRGTPPAARISSTDKVGHIVFSTGTFQPPVQAAPVVQAPPAVHVSTTAFTPSSFHPSSTSQVRPPLASTAVPSNAGKDPTSAVTPKLNRAHIRPDGRLIGPATVPQVPTDRQTVRSTPVHMHPQPSSRAIGAKITAPDQLPVKTENIAGPKMTAYPAVVQTPKPGISQTPHGTIPTMHHPVQGLQYVHPPAINHHIEIAKVVQKLLHPKLPQRPAWTPPSRDYMNKPHPCQFCKLIINEVENVAMCDACEKAYHLECLQSHNVKSIFPRGEWHCPRCLTLSHGKPFPPKYGRVTRNMNAPKGPSTASVAHFPSEKKMESVIGKVTQPNVTTNGIANARMQSQTVNVAEPSSGSNLQHGVDTGRIVMSEGIKKEVGSKMDSDLKSTIAVGRDVSLSTSTGSSSDRPPQQAVKFEVPEEGFISETESSTQVTSQARSASENLPTSNRNDVDQKLSNFVESPPFQHGDSNGVAETNQTLDKDRCENNAAKRNLVVADRAQDQSLDVVETSESDLHNIDWVGDIQKVADGKKFFHSCRINGVVYHVQDYALFRSRAGKLTPLRLQGMWEDSQTSSNWLLVHRCYFTDDLPDEVGRPGAPQSNEVYESTHDSCMMAGLIQGPCEVHPFRKFGEETEISHPRSQANEITGPVFIRNWFYDESKQAFCPNDS